MPGREADDQTLTEALARLGISHEPGANGNRILFYHPRAGPPICIGRASVVEGWNLVAALIAAETRAIVVARELIVGSA